MPAFDPTALHFLRPWWLLALIVALVMAALSARTRLRRSRWESVIDGDLREALIERRSTKSGRLAPLLTGLALATASIALAGPSWQRLPQPIDQKTDALVIVFDLSLSMYAQDVAPSRLVRARQTVTDILRARTEAFTGLVAFADDAHVVAPLTDDVRTIENLLAALAPDMMPMLGSNPRDALELARSLLHNAGMSQGRLLLVTDGVDRILDVSKDASPNFPISILGVGTANGGAIPLDFVGRPLTDRQGNKIIAKLDDNRLAALAQMSNGRYATIGVSDAAVMHLLDTPLPKADDERRLERKFDLWDDAGYWLVLLLVPLSLLNFRRGAVALLLCALLPPPAHANWWADLWQSRDQQGFSALQRGDPESAATLFRDPQWQGVASYRSGDYDAADEHFAVDPSATGNYNRGNALARAGKLEDAISAYEATLRLTPDDADAAFNKALLEKLLQQQQAQDRKNQESQRNRDQSNADQSREQNSADNSRNDSATPQNADQASSPPETEPQEAEQEEPQSSAEQRDQTAQRADTADIPAEHRDEKQDALEQWLRRVPDDPAGLLRRKFQYETQQRARTAGPDRREQERIW